MVKHTPTLVVIIVLLWASAALAGSPTKAGSFGLGLGSGTWTNGLSMRYNSTRTTAVQGNVGSYGVYGMTETLGFAASADYIGHRQKIKRTGPMTICWNIGVGVGLGAFSNVTHVRAAGVLGMEFNFNKFPLDIVLELRPSAAILPRFSMHLMHLTGHMRYYL